MLKKSIAAALFGVLISSSSFAADSKALVTYRSLTLETALELAQATLAACRKADYQVAIAVVDRSGISQVMLKDRFAGPHTPEMATRKARAAVSFRTDTLELADLSQAGKPASGIRQLPDMAMVGGGVMIRAAGSLVGAIGVSGAPGGDLDDKCAKQGLEKIQDRLDF